MTVRDDDDVLTGPQTLAVLGKELRIRLLNCSPSGCLIETASRLELGTVARLRVSLRGDEFEDDVQIVRCQAIEGAGPLFHVGVQFLWTGRPAANSLRSVIRDATSGRLIARGPSVVPHA